MSSVKLSPADKEILLKKQGDRYPEIKLTVAATPLVAPTLQSKRILIIGGGVSGLMTAWMLLDKGYHVTVLSKEWAWTSDFQHSRITSQIAGALWEFPPGGCGLTEIESPGPGWATIKHYREWALQSYEFYKKMNNMLSGRLQTEFGVAVTKLNQLFYQNLQEQNEFNEEEIEKLGQIRRATEEQRMDNLKEHGGNGLKEIFDDLGMTQSWRDKLKAGYTHDAPIINTDKSMAYLMAIVKNKGAELETREIARPLSDHGAADELLREYHAAAIVNATGLGAREVANDLDVYPVRGAIKRIQNNNMDHFEALTEAYLVPAQKGEDGQATKVVFLVPRNDECLIVGSIVQPRNNALGLGEGHPEVEIMWERARHFLPGLADAKPIPWYPLAQGLRPFTKKNVKVRADIHSNVPLVHNYGHGGSGWTLAVGTSRSVVHLLEMILVEGKTAEEANAVLYAPFPM